MLSCWLFLIGVIARQLQARPTAESAAWHSLQCAGDCWVPQQRGRQCLSPGENQWDTHTHTHQYSIFSVYWPSMYFALHTALPDSVLYLISYVFLRTTSQPAGEQRECGAVWPLQYMCVLEARTSSQWLSHSHPGPQRYQFWNEPS